MIRCVSRHLHERVAVHRSHLCLSACVCVTDYAGSQKSESKESERAGEGESGSVIQAAAKVLC